VELRNGLLFSFTGGSGTAPPTHKLVVRMSTTRTSAIVDLTTARPDIENYGIDVSYELREIATDKRVLGATTFARVSYDIPGQEQRFARIRGLRDAESRATKQIAENISQRLASFFVAGT
jgi:LPS-assembly lipoprotein